MTIQRILRNCSLPPLDAELILSHVLNKPREYLLIHPESKLTTVQIAKFRKLIKRRVKGEPIAYLLGKKEFYGLEFAVNKNVLVPRPETELLVELAVKNIIDTKNKIPDTVIDVGTGSGNIIISIVKNIPANIRGKIDFYASDISEKALNIAKKNAHKHKTEKFITFIKSDLLKFALKKKLKGNILIVANLPYVMEKIYRRNKKGLIYEPKQALFSRRNGLEHYTRLIAEIRKLRSSCQFKHISVLFEISPEQKRAISKIILKRLPQSNLVFSKDLSRRTRVMIIWANKEVYPGK